MSKSALDVANTFPVPAYRFRVAVGKDKMAFTAVSGLEMGVETIEYKDGAGGIFRLPGQRQLLTITLKRGLVKGQSQLYKWMTNVVLHQVEMKDISIQLTDEAGTTPLVTWNVTDAFPTKLTAPSFDASSNEVAIEEMTLSADRMTVEFH